MYYHIFMYENKIIGTGTEHPEQLLANPYNWRIHPKTQQDALESMLDDVGWVQNVIVNQRTGHVVDGHLRVAVAISREQKEVPVVYVDLDEDEEKRVLAALDPVGDMAVTDIDKINELLSEVSMTETLGAMLKDVAHDWRGYMNDDQSEQDAWDEWQGMPEFEQDDTRAKYKIVVNIESVEDLNQFAETIKQPLTEKTRFVYFPEKKPEAKRFNRYASNEE